MAPSLLAHRRLCGIRPSLVDARGRALAVAEAVAVARAVHGVLEQIGACRGRVRGRVQGRGRGRGRGRIRVRVRVRSSPVARSRMSSMYSPTWARARD